MKLRNRQAKSECMDVQVPNQKGDSYIELAPIGLDKVLCPSTIRNICSKQLQL